MNIDIESIKQAFSAIGLAVNTLKQVKDLLPDGTKKTEITETLAQAERQLKIAEAQSAQAMHYRLCQNHFPPEIMLTIDGRN